MNCSASIFSTATSARTSRRNPQVGADSGPADPARPPPVVAAIAAEANRPTSSLVSLLSATDAASVPSYLPTAATTGNSDSRTAADTRSSADRPPPHTVRLPQAAQLGGGVVVGEHPHVDAARHDAVLDVVHRVGHVVGPVHHLGLQARAARSGARSRIQSAAAVSSS